MCVIPLAFVRSKNDAVIYVLAVAVVTMTGPGLKVAVMRQVSRVGWSTFKTEMSAVAAVSVVWLSYHRMRKPLAMVV